MRLTKNGVLYILKEYHDFAFIADTARDSTFSLIKRPVLVEFAPHSRKDCSVFKITNEFGEVFTAEGTVMELCQKYPNLNKLYWLLKNYCGAYVYSFSIWLPDSADDLKNFHIRIHQGRGKNAGMHWFEFKRLGDKDGH